MTVSFAREGQEIGHHPEEAVPLLLASGELLPTDHYWQEGMAEWGLVGERWPAQPAPRTPKAGPVLRAPAPQSVSSSGSTKRWLTILLGAVALLALGAATYFYLAKPAEVSVPEQTPTEPPPAATATTATSPTATGRTISVVSWNIEWFPGRGQKASDEKRASHMKLSQAELQKLNPDIFLAQEIRTWEDFIELCGAVPDLQVAVVSWFLRGEAVGLQQTAIASKMPAVSAWFDNWKAAEDQPPRGYTTALLQVPGTDKLLLVYSLHLKSNLARREGEEEANYRQREESVRQLLAHIERMENETFKGQVAGVIVGGDFNTNHDGQFGDETIKMMTDAGFVNTWGDTARQDRHTWRGSDRYEPTTFDYIFVRGLQATSAELVEVSDETSDHWPLRVKLALPPK